MNQRAVAAETLFDSFPCLNLFLQGLSCGALRRSYLRCLCLRLADFADKTVAASRQRLNIVSSVLSLPQSFSKQVNMLRQITFLDELARPDEFHQVVFPDNLAAVSDNRQQGLDSLRRQRHGRAPAQQKAIRNVKTERAEFVEVFDRTTHRRFEK